MAKKSIHQPHDKLFKSTFGEPANATGFLRGELPAGLSAAILWDRLQLEPGCFIDSHYRHSESDLLFSAPLHGQDCLIYVLFEHQRELDRWLALRLLRYMVRIWEEFLHQQPEATQLPVIVPVVLAQNAQRWELPSEFASLLDIPAGLADDTRPFVPDFTFRLIQLADLPFHKILGTPAGIITLRVMKAERIAKLLDDQVWDEALMSQLPREILEFIIRYILDAGVDKDAFDRKICRITQPQIQSSAMTIAQQLRQEGRQEGLWVGKILALEELMGLAPTDAQALAALTIPELERRYAQLRREYDSRFPR